MRIIFTITAILYSLFALSQTSNEKVIIKKYDYGEVYITHDTSRREYKWLIPINPENENIELYNQYYSHITKDTTINIIHTNKIKIPSKWTPLYQIDQKYYLYGPSDWMYNYGYLFCDSTIIKQYSDGPDVNVVIDAKTISKKEFQFKILNHEKSIIKLTIYIIDKINQIAIWKFEFKENIHYELLVNSDNVKKFPIVNCDCGDIKCYMEYEFKPIDFNKIVKNIR